MRYVEVDVHKQSFQAAVVDETGKCLDEFRLRNNPLPNRDADNRTANSSAWVPGLDAVTSPPHEVDRKNMIMRQTSALISGEVYYVDKKNNFWISKRIMI